MKRFAYCFFAAALVCSCSEALRREATGEPVIPVREAGEVTEIYVTDYLPAVNLEKLPRVRVSGAYDSLRVDGGIITLYGSAGAVEVLSIGKVDIPILPKLPVTQGLTTAGMDNGRIILEGAAEGCIYRCFVQNMLADKAIQGGAIDIDKLPYVGGRSYLRVYASDGKVLYNDLLIPLQNGEPLLTADGLTRHDANAQVLYSLMVDRFYNGNAANDSPLNRPDVDPRVDYKGGDLKGITDKIEEGFFDSLGVNTIWISPISQNPEDAWGQYHNPDTKFSGYHGYWPIFNTKIDHRMGTEAELRELLETAHEHNINVILDYVANHMHINSPTLKAHPDWVTDSLLPDGRRNFELWDEQRLTTWFDKHIPSLDLEREEVCDAMTDTALFWVDKFDFDGYRHDACKHIPLNYWRMFTHKMKSRYPGRALWMIGETYGDNELIGSYVKTGMLNAQFDFNIYHTAIDVLGREGVPMTRMADVIDQSLRSYGAHHTMGNISGNHDKIRFISLAGGAVSWDEDGKDARWNRNIGVTADGNPEREAVAFKKALLLEVINLTIPGVPCIYQGDEYGQCGGNDPDNRRMMRFSGLSANEQWMLEETGKLIHLRRSSMPLLFGDYKRLYADEHALVFERSYMGEKILVGINDGEAPACIDLGEKSVEIAPFSYVII
ncbi:MAG: hypothetical protein IKR69_03990 [Bacteroidales bacterium]|nr:hypothetical protein [Bacteroidales bacterium]